MRYEINCGAGSDAGDEFDIVAVVDSMNEVVAIMANHMSSCPFDHYIYDRENDRIVLHD